MGQNNPYTREEIPESVKIRANELSKVINLTKEEDLINNDTMVLTRKQLLKQKTMS